MPNLCSWVVLKIIWVHGWWLSSNNCVLILFNFNTFLRIHCKIRLDILSIILVFIFVLKYFGVAQSSLPLQSWVIWLNILLLSNFLQKRVTIWLLSFDVLIIHSIVSQLISTALVCVTLRPCIGEPRVLIFSLFVSSRFRSRLSCPKVLTPFLKSGVSRGFATSKYLLNFPLVSVVG